MLNQLRYLFSQDVGLDLGTATTIIYVRDKGITLRQASAVAIEKDSGHFIAIGNEALELLGREPEGIEVILPVRDGVIHNFEITCRMLEHFFAKALAGSFGHPSLLVGVPAGTTVIERRAIYEAASYLDISEVFLIDEPLAAAVGAGLDIHQPHGSMVLDIGGGTADISVISLAGTVYAYSLPLAGDAMDQAIIDYLRHEHAFLIGQRTANRIKHCLGSAPTESNSYASKRSCLTIGGRAISSGMPATLELTGEDIQKALLPLLKKIARAVTDTLSDLPPEIVNDIRDSGVTLTGGGSLLKNLAAYLNEETELSMKRAKEPLECVVLGLQTLVDHMDTIRNRQGRDIHASVPLSVTSRARAA